MLNEAEKVILLPDSPKHGPELKDGAVSPRPRVPGYLVMVPEELDTVNTVSPVTALPNRLETTQRYMPECVVLA